MLSAGQRLEKGDRTAYVVDEPAWTARQWVYHRARKVFWNYRDSDRSLYEAGADEWLEVLVRVPAASGTSTAAAAEVEAHREALDFELRAVLARARCTGFPEALDMLEIPVPPASAMTTLPVLVLAHPHGTRLAEGPASPEALPCIPRVLVDLLSMLAALHEAGLMVGPLRPDDLVVDASGRWTFLGTHAIKGATDAAAQRDDFRHWARLCRQVLCGPRAGDEDTLECVRSLGPEVPAGGRADWQLLLQELERCQSAVAEEPPRIDSGRGAGVSLRAALATCSHWLRGHRNHE